ncbi:MAG: hypothetical protein HXX11_21885 [Desulfuromonadales bacterium]|nr:hypothetical protein [Desulfuromonadales bacterium]
MSLAEDDLYAALKELLEASQTMTSGKLPSATNLERYIRAVEWSKQVIARVERQK